MPLLQKMIVTALDAIITKLRAKSARVEGSVHLHDDMQAPLIIAIQKIASRGDSAALAAIPRMFMQRFERSTTTCLSLPLSHAASCSSFRVPAIADQLVCVARARIKSTTPASQRIRPVFTSCHAELTCEGSRESASTASARNAFCLRRFGLPMSFPMTLFWWGSASQL